MQDFRICFEVDREKCLHSYIREVLFDFPFGESRAPNLSTVPWSKMQEALDPGWQAGKPKILKQRRNMFGSGSARPVMAAPAMRFAGSWSSEQRPANAG